MCAYITTTEKGFVKLNLFGKDGLVESAGQNPLLKDELIQILPAQLNHNPRDGLSIYAHFTLDLNCSQLTISVGHGMKYFRVMPLFESSGMNQPGSWESGADGIVVVPLIEAKGWANPNGTLTLALDVTAMSMEQFWSSQRPLGMKLALYLAEEPGAQHMPPGADQKKYAPAAHQLLTRAELFKESQEHTPSQVAVGMPQQQGSFNVSSDFHPNYCQQPTGDRQTPPPAPVPPLMPPINGNNGEQPQPTADRQLPPPASVPPFMPPNNGEQPLLPVLYANNIVITVSGTAGGLLERAENDSRRNAAAVLDVQVTYGGGTRTVHLCVLADLSSDELLIAPMGHNFLHQIKADVIQHKRTVAATWVGGRDGRLVLPLDEVKRNFTRASSGSLVLNLSMRLEHANVSSFFAAQKGMAGKSNSSGRHNVVRGLFSV